MTDTGEVFYATLENNPGTKVHVDGSVGNLMVKWDADDRISIFNKTTFNQQYKFRGKTGDNSGYFDQISTGTFVTGNQLDFICAVYPYLESTRIGNDGVITVELPAVQEYREGSFGQKANTMVSTTDDEFLRFKNVGGYLVLKFYGKGVSLSSIKLEGNDHEKLSGNATVTPSLSADWTPKVTMSSTGGESITLTCDPPVELGATADKATVFWLVVPPTSFQQGFKLTVTDEYGNEQVKTATQPYPIERNKVRRIVPIEIPPIPTYSIENEKVAAFLDYVDANPYDTSDYSYSYVEEYYSGTGEDNRLDWPKPIPVSWTNPSSGNTTKVVCVYNDKDKTDLELSIETDESSTAAEIYSLIPGRTYYYTVTNGDDVIKKGAFKTAGRRRMIKVGDSPYNEYNANNCRDLGGQVTTEGKRIKYGKIYRGSSMDEITDIQKEYLKDYLKVRLDVDLRHSDEQKDVLELGEEGHTTQSYNQWSNLTDKARMGATLSRIFNAVSEDKVIYIHCKSGADRTGYVCMLLEAILGISQESCDIDYELTSFSGSIGPRPRTLDNKSYYYYRTVTYLSSWSTSPITTVQGVHFINTFPGDTFQEKAIHYITTSTANGGLGIDPEVIAGFQEKMLEE